MRFSAVKFGQGDRISLCAVLSKPAQKLSTGAALSLCVSRRDEVLTFKLFVLLAAILSILGAE